MVAVVVVLCCLNIDQELEFHSLNTSVQLVVSLSSGVRSIPLNRGSFDGNVIQSVHHFTRTEFLNFSWMGWYTFLNRHLWSSENESCSSMISCC